jgi:hypothetical protein
MKEFFFYVFLINQCNKKGETIMKKIFCFLRSFILIFVVSNISLSYVCIKPTYTLNIANRVLIAPNIFQFDIYLKHTNSNQTIFDFAGGQYFLYFNPGVANGGTLTYSFAPVPDNELSDMITVFRPRNPSISGNVLRLAPNILVPPDISQYISHSSIGTKVIRMQLSTSAPSFNNIDDSLQLSWKDSLPNPYTRINAYTGYGCYTNTEITNRAWNYINSNSQLLNPVNTSVDNQLTIDFVWRRINNVQSYILQISTDSLFNNLIYNNSALTDTLKTVDRIFNYDSKYYWRIGSLDSSGINTYSMRSEFSTAQIPQIRLKVNILMEGMYINFLNQLSRKDSVTIYLRNTIPPYSPFDSAREIIDLTNFNGLFIFSNAPSGTNYYIAAKHFNCIETWSSGGVYLNRDNFTTFDYDFTNSLNSAYGSNLILKGNKYCIYSGDVNQDGVVDITDYSIIDNFAFNVATGLRIPSDLNADNIVDLTDLQIADNNVRNFIRVIRP